MTTAFLLALIGGFLMMFGWQMKEPLFMLAGFVSVLGGWWIS